MSLIQLIGVICALILEGILLYIRSRKKYVQLKKTLSENQKLLAEKDNIIEKTKSELINREKTLAEKNKILAEKERTILETQVLAANVEKEKIELRVSQCGLQDKLKGENKEYLETQSNYTDAIYELTKFCTNLSDASNARKKAIKLLTHDVFFSFSNYIQKASILYKDEQSTVITSLILTEIIPFLYQISDSVDILNSNNVLVACKTSTEPLKVTNASFGHIERSFLSLIKQISKAHLIQIKNKLDKFQEYEWLSSVSQEIKMLIK